MDRFTMFKEYYDLISILSKKEQQDLYPKLMQYMFENIEPKNLNAKQISVFKNLKRPLDASKNKGLNAKKIKSNENQNEIKKKSKKNQKENTSKNVYVNNNDYDNKHYYDVNVYKNIIDYLNEKTNSHYKHTTSKTTKLIQARLNENFTIDDFKKVIDNKSQEWMGTEFENYLRPETLFGTKFESYLNQKNNNPVQKPMTYQERKKQEEDKMWAKFLAGGEKSE